MPDAVQSSVSCSHDSGCLYFQLPTRCLQVTLESEREKFKAQLAEVEDWLYMEGSDEPAAVFRCLLPPLVEFL